MLHININTRYSVREKIRCLHDVDSLIKYQINFDQLKRDFLPIVDFVINPLQSMN